MIDVTDKDGALMFAVKVIPRSSRTEIIGEHDGALKVKLSAPPVDGAANNALIKLFAKKFQISKGRIEIVAGETSRSKTIKIIGLPYTEFCNSLTS